MADIPSLNFTIRHALDRLNRQHNTYNEEFLERLRLVFGHPDWFGAVSSWGVVDPVDPASALAGDASRPLVVSANATNQLSIDINPGIAVTRSGVWIQLTDFVRQISLSDPLQNVTNVVYVRYVLTEAPPALNDKLELVPAFTARIPDVSFPTQTEDVKIGVDTIDVFNTFTESVLEDIVPIALATVQDVQDPDTLVTTTQLVIDHTRDEFTFNRPWFSAVDIEHRLRTDNPHEVTADETLLGLFTIIQLMLNHGMVVANDRSYPKVPGVRCQTSIPASLVLTDDGSGTATGFANKKYVELPNFPVRLGRVWVESTGDDLGAMPVETTNRVVFPGDDPPAGESVGVLCSKVDAAEPPAGKNEILFTTNNPASEQIILAGGKHHTQLASTEESFADASQYPMFYEIFIDGDGSLRKTPQPVFCLKRLDVIGTSDTPDKTQYGPAKIMMGLIGSTDVPAMSVKVRVYGKDENGADINHLFEYTGSDWSDPGPVPNAAIPSTPWYESLRVSDDVFASIDNVVIEERISDGPASAIAVWALLNPEHTYDKMKDACHVSEILWDGLRMAQVRDKRIIKSTNRDWIDYESRHPELELIYRSLAGGNATVWIDDLRDPRLSNLLQPFDDNFSFPSGFGGDIIRNAPWMNFGRLHVGLHHLYQTRGLPVLAGSGKTWRVTLFPQERKTFDPFFAVAPTFDHYDPIGAVWATSAMTKVPGLNLTYEVTTSEVPTRVRVTLQQNEYHTALAIYG